MNTKHALLGSAISIILCITMLIGTTFAWFTDTASTAVNTIHSGTLQIGLYDTDGNDLDSKTLSWQTEDGRDDSQIYWEPGCTYNLQDIVIQNEGDLALKYMITITGIQGDSELNDVIIWTIKVDDQEYKADSEFHLTAKGTDNDSQTLTISGHMQESAGNEYMEKKIESIAITVTATQDTVEYDSISDKYDENAKYDGEKEECKHENKTVVHNADGTHSWHCAACEETWDNDTNYTTSTTSNNNGTHTVTCTCGYSADENCTYANGYCSECSATHNHTDANHDGICDDGCGKTDIEVIHTYQKGYCSVCNQKDEKLSTVVSNLNESVNLTSQNGSPFSFDKTYSKNKSITIIIEGVVQRTDSSKEGKFYVMPYTPANNTTGSASSKTAIFNEDGTFKIVLEFELGNGDCKGFRMKKTWSNTNLTSLTVTDYSVYEGTIEEYEGSDN